MTSRISLSLTVKVHDVLYVSLFKRYVKDFDHVTDSSRNELYYKDPISDMIVMLFILVMVYRMSL